MMRLAKTIRENRALLFLLAICAIFLFTNLGIRQYGGDEAHFLQDVPSIATCGLPSYELCDEQNPLLIDNVNRLFPSLSFYYAFVAMQVFDDPSVWSRFFPALFGFLSVIVLYFLGLRLTQSKKAALWGTFFYIASAHFYIHARYGRYYGESLFLVTLLLYAFVGIIKKPNRKDYVLFAISGILLEYTQFQIAFYTLTILSLYYLLFCATKHNIKGFVITAAITASAVAPQVIFRMVQGLGSLIKINVHPLVFVFQTGIAFFYFFIWMVPIPLFIYYFFTRNKKVSEGKGIIYKCRALRSWLRRWDENHRFLFLYIIMICMIFGFTNHNGFPEGRKLLVCLLGAGSILLGSVMNKIYTHAKSTAIIITLLIVSSNIIFVGPLVPFKHLVENEVITTGALSLEMQKKFAQRTLSLESYQYQYYMEMTKGFKNVAYLVREAMEVPGPPPLLTRFALFRESYATYGEGYHFPTLLMVPYISPEYFKHQGINVTHLPWADLENVDYEWYLFETEQEAIHAQCTTYQEVWHDYDLWDASPEPFNRIFYNTYEQVVYLAQGCNQQLIS